jgi:Ca2+-binding RTX toxin-like protein
MRAQRLVRRVLLAVAVAAAVGTAGTAITATNVVPATYASQTAGPSSIDAQAAAAGCGSGLTSVVIGASGTAANDLLLGSGAGESLDGNAGDDCILGGGGNDTLRGSQGSDVCIGGPGTDSFHPTCETQIQ